MTFTLDIVSITEIIKELNDNNNTKLYYFKYFLKIFKL